MLASAPRRTTTTRVSLSLVPLALLALSLILAPQSALAKRPQSNYEPVYEHRRYRPHNTVAINDHDDRSAGIYFRISQKGVDYLASLVSDALPEIFTRMILPNVKESSLTVRDLIITRFDKPYIAAKFVRGVGVDLSLRLPHLEVTGTPEIAVFFASYKAQMLATNRNLTLEMRVSIHRNLSESQTVVELPRCEANPGNLSMQYFGADANEFYSISNLIQGQVQTVIKEKLCQVPLILSDFLRDKINELLVPSEHASLAQHGRHKRSIEEEDDSSASVIDHICRPSSRRYGSDESMLVDGDTVSDGPDVVLGGLGGLGATGRWIPDLSLRYPPTFSYNDFIVGIDGGMIVEGRSAADYIERPKFANVTLIRDQMVGLIISEYVPNTVFHQLHEHRVGTVSITYSLRHVPKFLQTIAKYLCSECRLVLTANLAEAPQTIIDRNGVILLLDAEITASFHRKNKVHNLLSSRSDLRVMVKPHFRHSRLHSDVLLAGFEMRAHKAEMSGLVAGLARKLVNWLVPKAIWPKVQQRIRAAIHYKGVEIPRFCTLELRNLHLDYIRHAAVASGDFHVDLPLLLRSFKQFMNEKEKNMKTRAELEGSIRYL